MSSLQTLVFYATPEHDCSYLPDRLATTLFVDPKARIDPALYSRLTHLGFRRSGSHYYRPRCNNCQACVSVRIPVQHFRPSRRQKRCQRRNDDLQQRFLPVTFRDEHFELYSRYIGSRHGDGDMYPPTREQYENFLLDARAESELIEYRDPAGVLVAVSVTDRVSDGLSAIYTFFDPEAAARSPGNFAILAQIQRTLDLGLSYLYLGYWIRDCRKMSYKMQFRPIEVLVRNHWVSI